MLIQVSEFGTLSFLRPLLNPNAIGQLFKVEGLDLCLREMLRALVDNERDT